jgi:hypothetical protein
MARKTVPGMLLLAVLVAMVGAASGQSTSAPFSVKISEMEKALVNGMTLMPINGFSQDVARNMPYVEVTNLSPTALVEFQLTIGDEMYHFSDDYFGSYAMLGKTTPGFDLTSTTANAENRLIVQFGNGGLQQNEVVRFKIDLDVDANAAHLINNAYPNYFTILVDNTSDPDDSDNAVPSARFSGSTSLVSLSPFPDIQLMGANGLPSLYYNGNRGPFGTPAPITTVASGGLAEVVPEPSSVLLVGFAGICLSQLRARRRPRATV